MGTTEDELLSFMQFVRERVSNSDTESRLPELFDLWMLQNPTDEDHAENVAAVNASINDFINGERGTPAGEHSNQLRQEFGFSDE